MSLSELHDKLDGIYRDYAGKFESTVDIRHRIGTSMDLAMAAGAPEIRDRLVQFLNVLSASPADAGIVLEDARLQTMKRGA